jgi:hypothetical protein
MSSTKQTDDGCGAQARVDNLSVDAEGARALARRIAEGKPAADEFVAEPRRKAAPAPIAGDGIVYIRAQAVRAAHQVRTFVQGPDGRLRRSR